jgi:hypothetical protein
MCVGRGQKLLGLADFALLELDGLGAQHGVRKIQVPLVRRGVGALGHVAQVAHEALVHHFPVVLLVHAVEFAGLAFVDEVEQGRERATQTHATTAAVADVEDPLHLLEAGFLVVEIRILPIEGMSCGGFQIAFAGHGVLLLCCLCCA